MIEIESNHLIQLRSSGVNTLTGRLKIQNLKCQKIGRRPNHLPNEMLKKLNLCRFYWKFNLNQS